MKTSTAALHNVFTWLAETIATAEATTGHRADDDEIAAMLRELGGDYEITDEHIERVHDALDALGSATASTA